MPDASSSSRAAPSAPAAVAPPPRALEGGLRAADPPSTLDRRTRVVVVLLHYIPPAHAALIAAPLVLMAAGVLGWSGPGLSLAALYLLPPAVVRLSSLVSPPVEGEHEAGSAAFLWWWFSAQWQVVFNRFPALEEVLRLVPLLYSAWLRAWGARVGRLVYWSPGAVVSDRQLVEVGDRAIIGAGARLVAHYLKKDAAGKYCLLAAPVRIGRDAVVGGWALLAPGACVPPGAVTRAARPVPPAACWRRDGKERMKSR